MPAKTPINIKICMGSSCYSRGNRDNINVLQNFIKEKKIEDKIEIVGDLCCGKCKEGPNLMINEKEYHAVDPASLIKILKNYLS